MAHYTRLPSQCLGHRGGRKQGQGQLWLLSEFKATWSYNGLCLRQKNQKQRRHKRQTGTCMCCTQHNKSISSVSVLHASILCDSPRGRQSGHTIFVEGKLLFPSQVSIEQFKGIRGRVVYTASFTGCDTLVARCLVFNLTPSSLDILTDFVFFLLLLLLLFAYFETRPYDVAQAGLNL